MALQLSEADLELLELKRIFAGLWPGCQLGLGDPMQWGVTQIHLRKFHDKGHGLIETKICFAPPVQKPEGYGTLGRIHENDIYAYCKTINHSVAQNQLNTYERKTGLELLREVGERIKLAEEKLKQEADLIRFERLNNDAKDSIDDWSDCDGCKAGDH